MNKPDPIAVATALVPVAPPSSAPEGSTPSGKAFAEVARLSPDEALRRLSTTAAGLAVRQVEEQLRSVGLNRVARQARHTVLGELAARSINPLNILLLSLATASYFLGDQRAAIMIAIMVVLSITLALQLPFPKISESMGNHDSKIVGADSVD